PMDLRRSSSARCFSGSGAPSTSTLPAAGRSSPVSAASSVDLPLPDGPRIATTLPRGTSRSMPSRIVRPPRSRRRPDKRTMGVVALIRPLSQEPGGSLRMRRGCGKMALMSPVNDFRLYHSNAVDVLAGLLAEELGKPALIQPLLARDTDLNPQVAMRRWLQATLAERNGSAANLEFLAPGEFVARALGANLPRDGAAGGGELDAASLKWHLYA